MKQKINYIVKKNHYQKMPYRYYGRSDLKVSVKVTSILKTVYKQGKVLYVDISNLHSTKQTHIVEKLFREIAIYYLIYQLSNSLSNRWIEDKLLDALEELETGFIVFLPLTQRPLPKTNLKKLINIFRNIILIYEGSLILTNFYLKY